MMKRKIIFLLNPIAGNGRRSDVRRLIELKCAEKDIDYQICPTNAEGNYDHVRHKILADGITDVVVAGGDGTISSVVENLRDTNIPFGLIPCGSGNGLALCAGISKNPSKAIDLVFTGSPVLTDGFYINKQFSCMLSGLGFDAQVAHDFARQKTRGLLTYVKQTYFNFIKAKPYRFEIEAAGKKIDLDAFFISVANSNQFGNKFTIAPKASLSDGLLDIVIVQGMNKLQMLFDVMRQVRKGEVRQELLQEKSVIYYQTPQLIIHNKDLAPLHIDGDPKTTSDIFEIKVIPGAFRLIRPYALSR